MNALFDLTGRVSIVTGGAGLLAKEHAAALSNYGATVILADINKKKCDEVAASLSSREIIVSKFCDVTSPDSWKQLLQDSINEFGKVDILVNNAGFTNQSKSSNFDAMFENFPLEDWDAIMNVNLKGTFLGCQVVGKQMLQQGRGVIINIASLYGIVSPNHRMYPGTGITQPVAYSVSKHGVIG